MTTTAQSIPSGYKLTEVGVIPNDWEINVLEQSASLKARIGWQGLTTAEYKTSGSYYLITGTEIKNGQIEWNDCFYIDKKRYDQDRNIQVTNNDVLVTKDGTIGKVAFISKIPKPATLNSGVFVIRPKNKSLDPKYLFYVLNSAVFDNFLSRLSAGSTINHLYQKDFVSFKFQKPLKKEEQSEIATTLYDLDSLIQKTEKLIAKRKSLKRGAMQELLTGRHRLPGFSGEWINLKLKDKFRVTRGQVLSMSKTSEAKIGQYKYPVYSSQTFNNGIAGYFKDYLFENCITWTTDGANAGDVKYRSGKFYCTNVCGVLENKEGYSNSCIAAILNSVSRKYVSYVGNPKLMNNVVADIEIVVPSDINEQKAISQVINDLEFEISRQEQKLEKYNEIKQGAMQVLLTGKIRLIKN